MVLTYCVCCKSSIHNQFVVHCWQVLVGIDVFPKFLLDFGKFFPSRWYWVMRTAFLAFFFLQFFCFSAFIRCSFLAEVFTTLYNWFCTISTLMLFPTFCILTTHCFDNNKRHCQLQQENLLHFYSDSLSSLAYGNAMEIVFFLVCSMYAPLEKWNTT